jgi:hypothetical protein
MVVALLLLLTQARVVGRGVTAQNHTQHSMLRVLQQATSWCLAGMQWVAATPTCMADRLPHAAESWP